jgi:hypothetical protein
MPRKPHPDDTTEPFDTDGTLGSLALKISMASAVQHQGTGLLDQLEARLPSGSASATCAKERRRELDPVDQLAWFLDAQTEAAGHQARASLGGRQARADDVLCQGGVCWL